MTRKACLLAALTLALLLPASGQAQLCTVVAGGANYTIPAASHYDNSQTSNFTGVGTGDQLFEDGWCCLLYTSPSPRDS